MLRYVVTVVWLALSVLPGQAATLVQLSMDDLVAKASTIVRGRVTSSWPATHDALIHTFYRVSVSYCWKGPANPSVDFAVPGGTLNGQRQTFPGVPQFTEGKEYVLFLWADPKGTYHLLGLSQGVFDLPADSTGNTFAVRHAITETMLDASTGRAVKDSGMRFRLQDLSGQIVARLPRSGVK